MTAATALKPAPGDWVLLHPAGRAAVWYQLEHEPRPCSRCPAGWVHLWCRPWHDGRIGPVRFIVAELDRLEVRRPNRGA